MRGAALALLVGAGLVLFVAIAGMERPAVYAQRPGSSPALGASGARSSQAGELMATFSETTDGRQQLVLVDTKSRVVGVYHIDRVSGQISLRSVRNVHFDLQMDEFNGGNPSPQEIRSLLPPR